MDLITPNRIYRCILKPYPAKHDHLRNTKTWKLEWDGGGSAESDTGERRAKLEEMLAAGTERYETDVVVGGKTVMLGLIVAKGLPWREYRSTLQALATNKLGLEEPSYFDRAMLRAAQDPPKDYRADASILDGTEHVNVWFDVENGILWTSYGAMGVYLQTAINALKESASGERKSGIS